MGVPILHLLTVLGGHLAYNSVLNVKVPPSRCLLLDCEIFAKLRLKLYLTQIFIVPNCKCPPASRQHRLFLQENIPEIFKLCCVIV